VRLRLDAAYGSFAAELVRRVFKRINSAIENNKKGKNDEKIHCGFSFDDIRRSVGHLVRRAIF
jgi:hypothetical protein